MKRPEVRFHGPLWKKFQAQKISYFRWLSELQGAEIILCHRSQLKRPQIIIELYCDLDLCVSTDVQVEQQFVPSKVIKCFFFPLLSFDSYLELVLTVVS